MQFNKGLSNVEPRKRNRPAPDSAGKEMDLDFLHQPSPQLAENKRS